MDENSGADNEAIITAFAADLQHRGLKPHTCAEHLSCAREYLERLTKLDLTVFEVAAAQLEDYRDYLESRPNRRRGGRLAPRTVQIHLNAVRALHAFLERSGRASNNPASCLRLPAAAAPERAVLTLHDIERLRAAACDPLDRAILAVFYGCGLRRAEGERLNNTDVDLHCGLLHVRSGKGGKPRSVPMGEGVMRDLLPVVRMMRPPGVAALFVNRSGRRMQAASIYRRVKQMALRAQLTREVTLHSLRHAVATHLLEAGLTLEQTRDFLGHRAIGTTTVYAHVNASEPQA